MAKVGFSTTAEPRCGERFTLFLKSGVVRHGIVVDTVLEEDMAVWHVGKVWLGRVRPYDARRAVLESSRGVFLFALDDVVLLRLL